MQGAVSSTKKSAKWRTITGLELPPFVSLKPHHRMEYVEPIIAYLEPEGGYSRSGEPTVGDVRGLTLTEEAAAEIEPPDEFATEMEYGRKTAFSHIQTAALKIPNLLRSRLSRQSSTFKKTLITI